MAIEFQNLGIVLPKEVVEVSDTHEEAKELFATLTKLDEEAKWVDKEDNMRIKMLKSGVQQGIEQAKGQDLDYLIKQIAFQVWLVMEMTIGDGWGFYEDSWFKHKDQPEQIVVQNPMEYKPIRISTNFGALNRMGMCFTSQPWLNIQTLGTQPFVERSSEPLSVKFAEEYYRYCCNPTEYPWSEVRSIGHNDGEWYPITPKVLQEMEKKIGAKLTDLKIHKFLDKEYPAHIMPTHGLLCQMMLINSLSVVPPYLATWHLGDPQEHTDQFAYYTQFIIHNNPNGIPNQQWVIKLLQLLVTLLKKTPWRLVEKEINIDDLFPLMKEQGIEPFTLYEGLLRDTFCLVNNITEGNTIWFKLTGTGMMFLYMCCPRI